MNLAWAAPRAAALSRAASSRTQAGGCALGRPSLPDRRLGLAHPLRQRHAAQRPATPSSRGSKLESSSRQPAQCAASAAACEASSSGAPLPPPDMQRQPVGLWASRALQLLGAAAAFAAWWGVSGMLQQGAGPFASLSLAAGGVSTEGLRSAIRSAWAGLAAGCLHTLAGADHLAALTPLTIGRSHLRASLLGALWGFGHSTGQLILGLLMVVLKDRFQQLVPALSKWGGTTVGLTLLAIGALGVYESFFEQQGAHGSAAAESSQDPLTGLEVQAYGTLVARRERGGFGLATFATGIIYGLQPDALFVIVPALALPTKLAAAAYIIMFVFGTVAAMGAYAGVIGATSAAIKKSNSGIIKNLSGFASFAAIAIGITVLVGGWGLEVPFFGGGH